MIMKLFGPSFFLLLAKILQISAFGQSVVSRNNNDTQNNDYLNGNVGYDWMDTNYYDETSLLDQHHGRFKRAVRS